jgi:hypothetical protein
MHQPERSLKDYKEEVVVYVQRRRGMTASAWNKRVDSSRMAILTGLIAAVVLLGATCPTLLAKGLRQKNFASPEDAVNALVEAVQAGDKKELLGILGPAGKDLISSGDEVEDEVGREKFLKAYDETNKLEEESAGKMILHIGKDEWPLQIPIVKRGNAWFFDTRAGKEEILNRRIGRNELNVIEVLHAYVDAQSQYAKRNRGSDGVAQFAQKIVSTEGAHDGLYWKAEEGDEMSPLGPLVAEAADEGYAKKNDGITFSPFHGYYYKILKGQGRHAEGGAYDYVVKGKMILGYALVAYPAQYGNSGIMTFMVNQGGVIYEKNLGKNTVKIARAMRKFDPDKTWKAVKETAKE